MVEEPHSPLSHKVATRSSMVDCDIYSKYSRPSLLAPSLQGPLREALTTPCSCLIGPPTSLESEGAHAACGPPEQRPQVPALCSAVPSRGKDHVLMTDTASSAWRLEPELWRGDPANLQSIRSTGEESALLPPLGSGLFVTVAELTTS